MKDFTPESAAAWGIQEAAKHTTPESRAQRIRSEKEFADSCPAAILRRYPNSNAARIALIRVLESQ